MKSISGIDKNFEVKTNLIKEDTELFDIKENDTCLFGLIHDTIYRRMPDEIAKSINQGLYLLHTNTAGGRLKFKTDSPYIYIKCQMPEYQYFSHMPLTGSAGFDIYINGQYKKTFIPPFEFVGGYDGICDLGLKEVRDITIHFPMYCNVDKLYLGLQKGSKFENTNYGKGGKIIFYGSSITQGGCVSRPGLAYTNLLSSYLDIDTLNLGFSGSAFGEIGMAEYIASLDCDIFVMDYDHNAPTNEHLLKTHEPFFNAYRAKRKNTPVVFMSAPNIRFENNNEWGNRRKTVIRTYENAKASGDENVFFVDGNILWGDNFDICSVDTIHPNDIGHYRMALTLKPVLEKILSGKK